MYENVSMNPVGRLQYDDGSGFHRLRLGARPVSPPHRRVVPGVLSGEQRSLPRADLTQAVLNYSYATPVAEASEEVRQILSTILDADPSLETPVELS